MTLRLEHSVVIDRPVEEVFAFITNPENDLRWERRVVESTHTSEGPMGVGTTGRKVRRFLSLRLANNYELTAFEPNRKLAAKTTYGPIPFEWTATLEAVEGGTRVTFVAEGKPSGIFKLAGPILARVGQGGLEHDSASLKKVLETQA
ncbi:MAG: SRPBCC family protein [Acidobacteria bacterium]|nr:SRPBCC family protein [Acidobacteriota bacterium]